MEPIALFLAVLAFVLAVPAPKLLHRARFSARSPRVAMLVWQTMALAGGLSLVGAPIVYGLSPFGASLPHAVTTALQLALPEDYAALAELDVHPGHIFALCLGVLLGGHLLLTLARTYLRVRSADAATANWWTCSPLPWRLQDGSSVRTRGAGRSVHEAQVIESEAPLAYCLPGRTNARSVTVLSRGLLEQLTGEEVAAVVRPREDALGAAPSPADHGLRSLVPGASVAADHPLRAGGGVGATEMFADDGALNHHSRQDLLRALALSSPESESAVPGIAEPAAAGTTQITGVRLQRLLLPPTPLGAGALSAIVASSAALLAVPTVLLLSS